MRDRSFVSAVIGAASLAGALGASPAFAGNFLSFISGKGNDVGNNCALPGAPCRTLAHALTQTNASGEVKTLDPGSYGAVTITKSVTITGVPGASIQLGAAGNGISINAGVNGIVSLRGIEIDGRGIGTLGIMLYSAREVKIVDCVVRGFVYQGIVVSGSNRGVSATISNSILSNNGLYGVSFSGPVEAFVDHTTMNDNGSAGARVNPGASVTITDSFAENNGAGFSAVGGMLSPAKMWLARSVAAGNQVGVENSSAAKVYSFGDNKVIGNNTDVVGSVSVVSSK